MSNLRLLIFDPELTSIAGHPFEYNRAVAAVTRRRGVHTTVMAHKGFAGAGYLEKEGVTVDPGISRSPWLGDYLRFADRGLVFEHIGILAQALSNFRDIRRHLAGRRYDSLFIPGTNLADVLTCYLLSLCGLFRSVDQLILLLRYDILDHSRPDPVPARKLIVWRWLFALFGKRIARGQVRLLADSPRLAADYLRVTGKQLTPISWPREMAPRSLQRETDGFVLTFGMTGVARLEKGIDLLLDAAAQIVASSAAPGARFLVQFDRPVELPDGSTYQPDAALLASSRVEILDHELSPDEYLDALERIDCMVLPYRAQFYRARASAVAIEAAGMGTPMIYTQDCWLEDFVSEQGAGVAVVNEDVASLSNAILTVMAEWPRISADAAERGVIARQRNDGEAFLTTLFGRPLSGDIPVDADRRAA